MNAAPDLATYYFTQGVLGVSVVALAIVAIVLYKRVQFLNDARLNDAKEVIKDVTTVVSANTQSQLILAEKIQSGKKGEA